MRSNRFKNEKPIEQTIKDFLMAQNYYKIRLYKNCKTIIFLSLENGPDSIECFPHRNDVKVSLLNILSLLLLC